MAKSEIEKEMHCSFCGKGNSEVDKIVAKNDELCICDECIMTCLHTIIYGETKPIEIDIDNSVSKNVKCTKEQSDSTA